MSEKHSPTAVLNDTGLLFELKVQDEIKKAGWDYISYHPLAVLPDPDSLGVQETIADVYCYRGQWKLIVEAKRSYDSEWLFFDNQTRDLKSLLVYEINEASPYRHPAVLVAAETHSNNFDLGKGLYSSSSRLSRYCQSLPLRKGHPDQNKWNKVPSDQISKAAKQASIGVIAAWHDLFDITKSNVVADPIRYGWQLLPIVVTNAELVEVKVSKDEIDLQGIVKNEFPRTNIPYLVYEYQLPRPLWFPRNPIFPKETNLILRDSLRKLDVIFVNIKHLGSFLDELHTTIY